MYIYMLTQAIEYEEWACKLLDYCRTEKDAKIVLLRCALTHMCMYACVYVLLSLRVHYVCIHTGMYAYVEVSYPAC